MGKGIPGILRNAAGKDKPFLELGAGARSVFEGGMGTDLLILWAFQLKTCYPAPPPGQVHLGRRAGKSRNLCQAIKVEYQPQKSHPIRFCGLHEDTRKRQEKCHPS